MPTNTAEMEPIREESNDKGLCYDMRGLMAEKIEEASATYHAHDAAKSLRN
jgi:hypothetical protein